MFVYIQLHRPDMGTLLMGKRLACVSDELSTMILRQEKKTHPKMVFAATSYAMRSLVTK